MQKIIRKIFFYVYKACFQKKAYKFYYFLVINGVCIFFKNLKSVCEIYWNNTSKNQNKPDEISSCLCMHLYT